MSKLKENVNISLLLSTDLVLILFWENKSHSFSKNTYDHPEKVLIIFVIQASRDSWVASN